MASDDEKRDVDKFSADEDDSASDSELNEKSPLLSKSESSSRSASPEPSEDPRFNRQSPSACKRLALLLFIFFLFWAAFQLRAGVLQAKRKSKVIYADRYSKEFKFRPAASPIITETLKDGRIRIRGATAQPEATESAPARKTKTSGKRKRRPKSAAAKRK